MYFVFPVKRYGMPRIDTGWRCNFGVIVCCNGNCRTGFGAFFLLAGKKKKGRGKNAYDMYSYHERRGNKTMPTVFVLNY